MKTIQIPIKTGDGKKTLEFSYPDKYEPVFDKYTPELLEERSTFRPLCLHLFLNHKFTREDEFIFRIVDVTSNTMFQDKMRRILEKVLETIVCKT